MRLGELFKKFLGLNLIFGLFFGSLFEGSAQFTFVSDYDRSFAAPNGYLSDPTDVIPDRDDEPAVHGRDFAGRQDHRSR